MQRTDIPEIDAATFHTDVQYLEALWQRVPMGEADMPLIDTGSDKGEPLVFVPILEHLEFVYARQVRAFGQRRRVIMYRRHETRTQPMGLVERAEELRKVLDVLGLERVDLVVHARAEWREDQAVVGQVDGRGESLLGRPMLDVVAHVHEVGELRL